MNSDPIFGPAGPIGKSPDRFKPSLDYIDREITSMGWLAGIAAAIGAGVVSQPLFQYASKEVRLGALLSKYPEALVVLIGCALLFGAAAAFLTQRMKITTLYGQACALLLADSDPTDLLNQLLLWKSWRPYLWGLDLFAVGAVQTAIGVVYLSWRIDQGHPMSYTLGLWIGFGAPTIVLTISKLHRAGRFKWAFGRLRHAGRVRA